MPRYTTAPRNTTAAVMDRPRFDQEDAEANAFAGGVATDRKRASSWRGAGA
jgi:hypothetical protein